MKFIFLPYVSVFICVACRSFQNKALPQSSVYDSIDCKADNHFRDNTRFPCISEHVCKPLNYILVRDAKLTERLSTIY